MRGEELIKIGRLRLVKRDGKVYIDASGLGIPVSRADLQALLDAYPEDAA